jgi:Lon protease-like protein
VVEFGSGWPPAPEARPTLIAPVFPLPNVFLFPGALMPLHVFEPRYRQMIEDSLDGPGRIVMAAVLESHHTELAGAPPLFEFAGLGEIRHHERLPDGRFFVNLVGCCRVRIREVASDRLYRRVEATPLCEVPATREDECRLRPELVKAVLARTPKLRGLPLDMPLAHLADFLLMRLELPQGAMQEAFARLSIADRARRALEEHARRPGRAQP